MANERQPGGTPLKAVHIDLQERSITLEASSGPATRLRWSPTGVLYELLSAGRNEVASTAALTRPASEQGAEATSAGAASISNGEREPLVTLTGRIKSRPVVGKRDGQGKPTTWARFAAHVEGEDAPHVYSTTFHRHTADVARDLPKEAQITVRGYVHPSNDPTATRLDTLSVVTIVAYPGKPQSGKGGK